MKNAIGAGGPNHRSESREGGDVAAMNADFFLQAFEAPAQTPAGGKDVAAVAAFEQGAEELSAKNPVTAGDERHAGLHRKILGGAGEIIAVPGDGIRQRPVERSRWRPSQTAADF